MLQSTKDLKTKRSAGISLKVGISWLEGLLQETKRATVITISQKFVVRDTFMKLMYKEGGNHSMILHTFVTAFFKEFDLRIF
jgi:hypothetical protein